MTIIELAECISSLRDLRRSSHPWAKWATEMVRNSLRRTTEAHMFNLACALAEKDLKTTAWVCGEMAKVTLIAAALPDDRTPEAKK